MVVHQNGSVLAWDALSLELRALLKLGDGFQATAATFSADKGDLLVFSHHSVQRVDVKEDRDNQMMLISQMVMKGIVRAEEMQLAVEKWLKRSAFVSSNTTTSKAMNLKRKSKEDRSTRAWAEIATAPEKEKKRPKQDEGSQDEASKDSKLSRSQGQAVMFEEREEHDHDELHGLTALEGGIASGRAQVGEGYLDARPVETLLLESKNLDTTKEGGAQSKVLSVAFAKTGQLFALATEPTNHAD